MKPGENIKCPHCDNDAFLVKKTLIDGWTKTGDILVCSGCSCKIIDIEETQGEIDLLEKKDGLDKLAGFLVTDRKTKPSLKADDSEKHFCKNCEHYVLHPFFDRCSFHNKNVGSMDDCSEYKVKEEKTESN